MIFIFHGDDQSQSRQAFNQALDDKKNYDILRVDNKEISLDTVNAYVNSQSLFSTPQIIAVSNFFSIPKPILDKLLQIFKLNPNFEIYIWQDKTLTPTQTKIFPQAKIKFFPLDKIIFQCLNNLRPNNLAKFITLYNQVAEKQPFELFLFWLKFNLRKQLSTYSKFPIDKLKTTYLQIIELDYQSKTGQLTIPKEIALERILLNILK